MRQNVTSVLRQLSQPAVKYEEITLDVAQLEKMDLTNIKNIDFCLQLHRFLNGDAIQFVVDHKVSVDSLRSLSDTLYPLLRDISVGQMCSLFSDFEGLDRLIMIKLNGV